VVYLHYAQTIGVERLATLMDEIFTRTLSEGARPIGRLPSGRVRSIRVRQAPENP
jgi:hypothetical protein